MKRLSKISFALFILTIALKIVVLGYFSYSATNIGNKWLYYENHEETSVFVVICSILPENSIQYAFCMLKYEKYSDDAMVQPFLLNLPNPEMSKFNQLKEFNK